MILWETATGALLHALPAFGGRPISSIAFSPDGKLVAFVLKYERVNLWESATGAFLRVLDFDEDIHCVSFSKEGQLLITYRGNLPMIFDLQDTTLPIQYPTARERPSTAIFIRDHWVWKEMERLLWLPPAYRPSSVAYENNILVLGHPSGQVSFLEFQ